MTGRGPTTRRVIHRARHGPRRPGRRRRRAADRARAQSRRQDVGRRAEFQGGAAGRRVRGQNVAGAPVHRGQVQRQARQHAAGTCGSDAAASGGLTDVFFVPLQASFVKKKLNLNGRRVNLAIWDTAGQERFHALGPIYYRMSNGAVLVYDITDEDSFQKVISVFRSTSGRMRDNPLGRRSVSFVLPCYVTHTH